MTCRSLNEISTAQWQGLDLYGCGKGSRFFPPARLSPHVMPFYEIDLHVVAPELQYVLKEHPELMNPGWLIREQDILEREYLWDVLIKKGIDIRSLHTLIASA